MSPYLGKGTPLMPLHLQQLHEIVNSHLPADLLEEPDHGLPELIHNIRLVSAGVSDNTTDSIKRDNLTNWSVLQKDTVEFLEENKGLIKDGISQGNRVGEDVRIILDAIHTKALGQGLDDKQYLIERVIQLATSFKDGSKAQKFLTGTIVKGLWESLQHPPLTYLGDENEYRSADGSNNNLMYPNLGKAGTPYARAVIPSTSGRVYPDPSEVFDKLLARHGRPEEHPNRISSMLFYLATIIIHDAFRTGEGANDRHTSSTSSYLDLSPLYGHNMEEQEAVRTMKDGMLKPDTFSDHRLLGFPPGVCALLVTFNRFHNHAAAELKHINEGRRFSPSPLLKNKRDQDKKIDNDLFNTARLVTCGLYVNIILGDYVRTILNMNYAPDSNWVLDPRGDGTDVYDDGGFPRGIGNQVSCEFNFMYRWHSTLSVKDEKWVVDFFSKVFPGQDVSKIHLGDFLDGLRRWRDHLVTQPPEARNFGGLKRDSSGHFDTADLAKIILESTEDVGSAFGARQTPIALKLVTMLGIHQARSWHVGTLNELRKFMKLKPHRTFQDINPNPDIQAAMKSLYKDPNFVEMYPGVIFEDSKVPYYPGSGLCAGFTITRAILSDAVSLVRGDRFYTVGWSRATMTDWGFDYINSKTAGDQLARGGKMHLLLGVAFPKVYRENSVWKLFPFTTPNEIQRIFEAQDVAGQYDFSSPL